MDIIFIEELLIYTNIGIYSWEQKIKQKLLINIKIGFNRKKFVKKNKIKYYLDYSKISKIIVHKIEKKKYSLIEYVAQEISEIILNQFKCEWVEIKIQKPTAIPRSKTVGLIIKRKKNKN